MPGFRSIMFSSVAATAVLLAAGAPALAQSPVATATTVSEVVITRPSLEQTLPLELAQYGSDLEIVTGDTIKNAGYIDVSQALQMQTPGLYLAPRNGPFSYVDISLQGSRSGDVLWTVDGVRINNRLYTSTSPADTLPASMIERIEVLKGGQSLFYGTQAAAGVLNVVTRDFSDEFGGAVALGGDTNDGVHANAYVRGAFGPHKFVAWVSKDEAEGYETYDAFQPSATARKRGYDVVNIGAKYRFDFTDDLRLSLQYQHTDAHLEYPGARLTAVSFNDRDEDIVSAKLDYTPSEQAQVFVKAYYHDWDTLYTTLNNDLANPGRLVVSDLNAYWGYNDRGVNLVAKLRPTPGIEYLIGYDYQSYEGVDEVLLIAKQSEKVHAGILQVRTTEDMFANARFAAGLRYDKTGQSSNTIWNVSGRWDPSEAFYVEGTAGTSFILPSAEQLFGIDPCCAAGNPNLKPEKSLNANLAIGGKVEAAWPVQWQVTAFARKVEDLIVDDYDQPAFPDGIYLNTNGQVKVSGAEARASLAFTPDLTLNAAYTYTRAREQGSGLQLARTPQNFFKGSLVYAPADRPFGGAIHGLWVGEVYSGVTGFGRLNYGDYFVVDLSAHVFLDGDARRHKLGARVENLFDQAYATRINSALVDNSTARFVFRNRGVPRTLQVSYTYEF